MSKSRRHVIEPVVQHAADASSMAQDLHNWGGAARPESAQDEPMSLLDRFAAQDSQPADDGTAIERVLQTEPSQALPGDVARRATEGLGRDMGDVRLFTGPLAAETLRERGVRALTWGTDILATDLDPFVLFHELAHVAQHAGAAPTGPAEVSTGAAGGLAESEADEAAAALGRGEGAQVSAQSPAARGFGATAPVHEDERDEDAICHENQTVNEAMEAGFSEEEAFMIYSGNWQRDMNQLLLPLVDEVNPAVFEALSIAHTKQFGFPLPSVEEFGTYDPVEHIDNPAGLSADSIFDQDGDSASSTERLGTEAQSLGGTDPRYAAEAQNNQGEVVNSDDHAAFQVDESALPVYLRASRTQMIDTLWLAVNEPDEQRGLRLVGEALHVMQDYYAHSNFCEIGLNLLLTEAREDDEDTALESIMGSVGLGLGDEVLNTYVHDINGMDIGGANSVVGDGREVMATGTFMTEDTAYSLKEKLNAALGELNPFDKTEAGADPWVVAVLDWMQGNPEYVPALDSESVADHIRGLSSVAGGLAQAATVASAGVSQAANGAAGLAANAMGWAGLGGGGRVNQAAAGFGQAVTSAVDNAPLIEFNAAVDALASEVEGVPPLSGLYTLAYETVTPWTRLSYWAAQIPGVGEAMVEAVRTAEDYVRATARALLDAAWQAARAQVVAEFNVAVDEYVGNTDVSGAEGATHFTQPTHTDIAKDFDAHGATGDADGDGEHEHRHGGAWLSPLADEMAHASSLAILQEVECQLQGTPSRDSLEQVVHGWFAHPEDCRSTWESRFTAVLSSTDASTIELLHELSRRTAQPPQDQAPNHIQEQGVGDDHDEHDHD